MANLLEMYQNMRQAEMEKVAETQESDARTEVLVKYASLADELMSKEYGNNYNEDDVVKLAQLMINHDLEQEEAMEKVSEYYQAGVIMAEGFKDSLNRQ